MKREQIEASKKTAERRLGAAVSSTPSPVRRRRAIYSRATRLGLRGLERDANTLDKAASDTSHPVKHKFVDQGAVRTANSNLIGAASRAGRRRAWADRDRSAMAVRNLANTILNLLVFAAVFAAILYWIGAL